MLAHLRDARRDGEKRILGSRHLCKRFGARQMGGVENGALSSSHFDPL